MKFTEIVNTLGSLYPKSLPWDKDGVEVNLGGEVQRVLVALDFSVDALEYAAARSYDCIIAHHPLIFAPMGKFDCDDVTARKAIFMAVHGISGMSLHTRLDIAKNGGVSSALADALGFNGCEHEYIPCEGSPCEGSPCEGSPCRGSESIGIVVDTKMNVSIGEFASEIKRRLEAHYKSNMPPKSEPIIISPQYTAHRGKINRVGIVAGSGMDYIRDAMRYNIDAFVTGEGSYHKIFDIAEDRDFLFRGKNYNKSEYMEQRRKINSGELYEPITPEPPSVVTIGHYESEAVVLPVLRQTLLRELHVLEVDVYYK